MGAADGFFSRELDRRGAAVTALDYKPKQSSGFAIMEKLHGKSLTHMNTNISNLSVLKLAPFDIVLFLGVLYHLLDPVRALWDIRQLVKGDLWLESYIQDFSPGVPAARYFERDTLGGDITNFWAPNSECIESMLRDAGFSVVATLILGDRALYHARTADLGPHGNVKMNTAYGFLQVRQKYLPR
ncbi:MAG: methyltransferase domain-containing protein [Proteobacteria bacterium]|nr:methyltransferase domain-containing protein [Pseudomonadota bacterium]